MLTIIYPYRNRDLQRLKNSLDSLKLQLVFEFKVFFVDYGSKKEKAKIAKKLCGEYGFITYSYCYTKFQPWNKSRALNSVIKKLDTDYIFVADVDMVFHPKFVQIALNLRNPNKAVCFQVGFLRSNEYLEGKEFAFFKNFRKSSFEATGLSMFPVKALKEIRGFDEFYHFWGAEDTDIHVRLKNSGYHIHFYDDEVLMLHQWHPSYRSFEKNELTQELQIKGIVQLNHQHLKFAQEKKIRKVNTDAWGEVMSKEEFLKLQKIPLDFVLENEKRKIDDFLYGQLPGMQNKMLKIRIEKDLFQHTLKYKVKRLLGKKVPEYYTLKEINDKVLMHLISFYRNKPFNYKISNDLSSIELVLKI